MRQSLFDALGGLPTFQKVHKIFYDKIYAHEWLKEFFVGHDQQVIEDRQTAFMALKMGGKVEYPGRELPLAHRHMYITRELFDLRSSILKESLQEAGVPDDLAEQWLRIDNTFFRQIVKDSMGSFYETSWKYKPRVIIPKP